MNGFRKSLCIFAVVAFLPGTAAWSQDGLKKVTRAEAMGAVVSKVEPEFPATAKQLRMQGTVELEISIGENGEVTKVEIVKGNPVLTAAAAQAVKHWKFKPFEENGKPIPVVAPIEVTFKL